MFKFVGKLTRLGCDATICTLKGVLNIPGDIVAGYKEGFNPSEEKPKTVEVKAVKTRKKTPKTVAAKTTTTARVAKTPVAKTTKSVPTKKTATTRAKVTKVT